MVCTWYNYTGLVLLLSVIRDSMRAGAAGGTGTRTTQARTGAWDHSSLFADRLSSVPAVQAGGQEHGGRR